MQDTPGTHSAGADTAILKHILKQNQEYMAREEDPRRVVPMSTLPDPRVDVCLYFLSPHFLKPQDVALMTRLSELVPVVPIIAKVNSCIVKNHSVTIGLMPKICQHFVLPASYQWALELSHCIVLHLTEAMLTLHDT